MDIKRIYHIFIIPFPKSFEALYIASHALHRLIYLFYETYNYTALLVAKSYIYTSFYKRPHTNCSTPIFQPAKIWGLISQTLYLKSKPKFGLLKSNFDLSKAKFDFNKSLFGLNKSKFYFNKRCRG